MSLDEDHRFSQDLSLLIFHKICCAPLRGANRKEKEFDSKEELCIKFLVNWRVLIWSV